MKTWLRSYILLCTGVLVAILAVVALIVVFGDLGLSLNGTIALFLGIIVTTVLGMGLMGLLFASHHSGHDDDAHPGDLPGDPPR